MSGDRFLIAKLEQVGALWRHPGHGPHGQLELAPVHCDTYINTDILTSDPVLSREVASALISNINAEDLEGEPVIATYVTQVASGIILATHVANLLSAKLMYVNTEKGTTSIRLPKRAKVILVCEDIYTGNHISKTVDVLENLGANIRYPILTIANFLARPFRRPVLPLISIASNLWSPEECELCKLGSKAFPVRSNWSKFFPE